MKKLSFYEQVGIVIPGSVLVFGLVLLEPKLQVVFAKDGITVGGFGIFVFLAYASGHLVAALGNLLEFCMWGLLGGMPSNWVVDEKSPLLSDQQISLLKNALHSRLKINVPVVGMAKAEWNKVYQLLYRDVLANKASRAETFNGNYGLNRGLAAATLALSILVLILAPDKWDYSLVLVMMSAVLLYRAYRFGVHFAREIYAGFLLLSHQPPTRHGRRQKQRGSTSTP